ncbi:MAG: ABC transporter ATP-binding protein [Gemmatimonadetes bacterium]|nr:ABC transporter ATP-binding protein [Gemmatimonadota bacterium]
MVQALVQAVGMGYRYPSGRIGLEPLDFSVGAGEIVAAIGPNGSGKSTLIRLLATDLRATVGSLSLLGSPVRGSPRALRRGIAYAPDDPLHLPWLTGEENARFFAVLRAPAEGGARDGAAAWDGHIAIRIAELFRAFHLDEVREVPVAEYSFGMRRKLLLLEALAATPNLLLLDEPTVGLDPPGTGALRKEVGARAAEGGAVVIATNDTREIPYWADRILFLHRGRTVADAPLATLLRQLQGRTRIEIRLGGSFGAPDSNPAPVGVAIPNRGSPDPALPGMERIPGVESVEDYGGSIVVESSRGSALLPELIGFLLSQGAAIAEIRVREPDLGDLFQEMTGEKLGSAGEEP